MVEACVGSYPLVEVHPTETHPMMLQLFLREILEIVKQIANKIDWLDVEFATIRQTTFNRVELSQGCIAHYGSGN